MIEVDSINLKFPKDFFKNYACDQECQVRIASLGLGIPCNYEPGATVLAHYTGAGLKAMGSRKASAPDLCAAWACSICHDIIDARLPVDIRNLSGEQIKLYHLEGVMRTLDALVRAGVLPNP